MRTSYRHRNNRQNAFNGCGALLFARYAGDDMSDGPMMLTPILIISSRMAFS
jgi:hypothetical protein